MGQRGRATTLSLVLPACLFGLLAVRVWGHASNTLQSCSTQMEPGVRMMAGPIQSAPSAAVQVSRAGTVLGSDALTYVPGETLSLTASGTKGEIAWEASGGATFTSSAGCSGRRSIASAPKLKMPTTGGPVSVWAGYAQSQNTVYVTPKVTLTAAPPPTQAPTPEPNPIAPGPAPFPPATSTAAPTFTPTPPPSPEEEEDLPPAETETSTTNTFAAFFAITLNNLAPASFHPQAAQQVIADTAGLASSQVYILASSPNPSVRLVRRFLQAASTSATDLAIRLTNLPDRGTASQLVTSIAPFLIASGPNGFASRYANAAGDGNPAPAVVLQSTLATSYAFPLLGSGACLLDAKAGLILSWDLQQATAADGAAVELQLEGNGEGWLGGGLVGRESSTTMVANPTHKVLIADYTRGGEPALVSMQARDAAGLVPVANASDYGVRPTLLQAAGGKLVLRYRQEVDRAAPGKVDVDGVGHFMYAYAPYEYPNMHTLATSTTIDWRRGTCGPPAWVLPNVEGYWLLPLLPLLALLTLHMCLKPCYPGPLGLGKTLLQRRLAAIPTHIPTWLNALTLGSIPTWCNMKMGEVVAILLYLALQVALLLYWSLQAGPATARSAGIALGKAALTNTMLTLLPASKTSLWTRACGLPFERALRLHKWLSYLAIATMTAHLVCLARPTARMLTFTPLASGVVVGCGTLAYLCVSSMALAALVRRWAFEVFRYAHYLFIAGVGLIVVHAPQAWLYMVGPCALHLLDFCYRCLRTKRNQSSATLHALPGGITRVDIRLKNRQGRWTDPIPPGAYLFLNVPALSIGQWHPISLSAAGPYGGTSAVEASPTVATDYVTVSLHVRALGKGTWTHKLYQLALTEEEKAGGKEAEEMTAQVLEMGGGGKEEGVVIEGPLNVSVDGPYGCLSVNLGRYRRLVLFAGGIGITPLTTTLAYLIHEKRQPGGGAIPWIQHVTLVWAVREEETYAAFAPFLEQALEALNRPAQRANDPEACVLDVEVYMTSVPSSEEEEEEEGEEGGAGEEEEGEAGLAFRRRLGRGQVHLKEKEAMRGIVSRMAPAAGRLQRRGGRPNVCRVMDGLVDVEAGEQHVTAALACAPQGMLYQIQRQCVLRDIDLHLEEFAW